MTMDELAPAVGLRERSKARRRALIQRTALELFAERGYDSTTVADIADAAEVARRTVLLYFPTKADLALAWTNDLNDRIVAMFEADPDAGFLEIIDRWLLETHDEDTELSGLAVRMYRANPELRALRRLHVGQALAIGRASLARELGLPPRDPRFAVVANAVWSAIDEYRLVTARKRGASLHQWLIDYLRTIIQAARPA